MSRPVIGISTYREPVSWGEWTDLPAAVVPAAYLDSVSAAGGTPVLLPPFGPRDDVAGVVGRLDGLVLAGGTDVNPSRYSAEPHERTVVWRDDRDVSEMALLHAAADHGLPVLGICRGMQMMAVVAGGSLHQHVPDLVGHTGHSPGPRLYGDVKVTAVEGSKVASILGSAPFMVRSHHHQAVATHPGLVAAAVDTDGLIQAIEIPGHTFWIGVQWHPEVGEDLSLFEGLVKATRAADSS
ncbi:gamma-glutamyl-gamma-aminobutyrate hydrolase family protein [Nakamurella silvestris]|nr:gamma-glutamyl-gamma-aminobutyrate hydrolase family protein [Nakamurella silvestris]